MKLNIQSKELESKLYFIIFFLVAVVAAVTIYNFAFKVYVEDDPGNANNYVGILRPHLGTEEEQ